MFVCVYLEKVLIIYLHNCGWVPMYGVVVEISCGVKPEVKLLLFASISLCVNVCVDYVRLSRNVP